MSVLLKKSELLREFLEGCEKPLALNRLYPFFRYLSGALNEDKRWKAYTKESKERGYSADGQTLPESVLEHNGIDTPILGAAMLALEKSRGTDLDYEILPVVFFLHDIGESSPKGDIDFYKKTVSDDEEEDSYINKLISVFPPDAQMFFKRALDIAGERTKIIKKEGKPLSALSKNGRFFWGVETVWYLGKASFEVEEGNKPFAKVFYGQLEDLLVLREEFYSVRCLTDGIMPEIIKFFRENSTPPRKWEEWKP